VVLDDEWDQIGACKVRYTAYRDILDLVERGALQKDPGGGRAARATHFPVHLAER